MLTIQNVRKDIGINIDEYTLCDSGLCCVNPNANDEYYLFHWNAYGIPGRFKFLLDREPAKGKPSIYRIRLYDTKLATPGTNRDGFVVETQVGRHLLNDRIEFYRIMITKVEQYLLNNISI